MASMATDDETSAAFSAFRRPRTGGGNKAFHNFYNDYSHISDPNLRRRLALTEIDKVPFGMYHVRAVLVAGVGFFTDSYVIYSFNLITTLLGVVFWGGSPGSVDSSDGITYGYEKNNGVLPNPVNAAIKASTIAGMLIGQVAFGWLADVVGRRKMYGVELGIIVMGTLGCALVSPSLSVNWTALMVFWRVVTGIGIGGDYPLSAVITAEFAPTRWRGAMVAAVFAMNGLGQLLAAIVALATTASFRESYSVEDESKCGRNCQLAADRAWRIIVGIGAVPAVLALYYRLTIPETPRYTFDVAHDVEKADADIRAYVASKREGEVDTVQQARMKEIAGPSLNVPRASWADVAAYFREWKNIKVFLGTTMSWFFLDFAAYGLGLNSTTVLQAIGYARGSTLYEKLFNQAKGTIILASAGALPGYLVAILSIDTIGRKPAQMFGFIALTILFAVVGYKIEAMTETTLLIIYVVGMFFFNVGPNTTTFIVPAEVYPTRYRTTGHGLSAACGRIGALIAQGISIPLLQSDATCTSKTCGTQLDTLLKIFALCMFLGSLTSFLIPETKGVTLEELAGEPPTSYNAGRNGSIALVHRHRWNPFKGGQPAGFNYPLSSGLKSGLRTRGDGASSKAGPSDSQKKGGRLWAWSWHKGRRGGSDASEDLVNGGGSSGNDTAAAGPAQVPTWGAGWGRIDRGEPQTAMESLRLQDVSNLLREESARSPASVERSTSPKMRDG